MGSGRGRQILAIGVVLVVLAAGWVVWEHPGWISSPSSPHGASTPSPPPPAGNTSQAIQHVVLILFENAERSTVLSNGPFFRHLAYSYESASNYYGVTHPSAPNYLALTDGRPMQSGSDAYHVYNETNLADLLEAHHLTWGAYLESMPSPCDTHNAQPYAVKHNPFVYYSDIVNNPARCQAHDQSLDAWNASVASGTVPNFAFIAPNMNDDGHNTSVAYADHWLEGFLSPLLNDSFFQHTVFFLTWDEGLNSVGFDNRTQGGNVLLEAISPFVPSGSVYSQNANHYSLLTTIEWLLGLPSCGGNDNPANYPPMTPLFTSAVVPPTPVRSA